MFCGLIEAPDSCLFFCLFSNSKNELSHAGWVGPFFKIHPPVKPSTNSSSRLAGKYCAMRLALPGKDFSPAHIEEWPESAAIALELSD
jgi:hypothetical protein